MTQETEMTNSIVSKDALVGTWKLVEVKSVDKEQKNIYPYGKNPVGYTIYTQDGYISSSIIMSNRLSLGLPIQEIFRMAYGGKPKITNLFNYLKATLRYVQAGNKYASYICKYEIRDNKLIYHIEVSLVPDFIGTDLEMAFEISEDQLVITRLYGENKDNSVIATWKRVS